MPRTPINYSNTIIYKIQHIDNDELLYVGHTTEFTKRKTAHKSNTNNIDGKEFNNKVYKMIRENGGWDMFNMIEIKKFSCNDKREAAAEEDRIMRELKATMNTQRACMTKEDRSNDFKEFYKQNSDSIKQKVKCYREANKEKISEFKKKYQQENAEEIKLKKQQYYKDNAEKFKEKAKLYRESKKNQDN